MEHWSEYEPYDITNWFDVQCNECEKLQCVHITASVWRDGSMYAYWHCEECSATNFDEDLGSVSDLVDHDAREGK